MAKIKKLKKVPRKGALGRLTAKQRQEVGLRRQIRQTVGGRLAERVGPGAIRRLRKERKAL